MTPELINIIQGLGIIGLFITMVLEGSSLPFPGLVVTLTLGYLLHPGIEEVFWLASGMSLSYTLASFIPYGIGRKLGTSTEGYIYKRLSKVQFWFRKYGEWSICISRPFGFGNYISYIAGMSRIEPLRYSVLTFVGIFPWAFTMLILGNIYRGSYKVVYGLFEQYDIYLLLALGALLVVGWLLYLKYRKSMKGTAKIENS